MYFARVQLPTIIASLLLIHAFSIQGQPCHDHILVEAWEGSQLIRYNTWPCSSPHWLPFCEESGWGDEEASVTCRQLGHSFGTGGFSTTYLGAQGYSSIECEGTEARLDECDIDEVDTSHYCSYVGVVKCYDVPQAYVSEPMEGQLVSEGPVELCVAVRGSLEEAVPVLVETRGGGSAIAGFDYVPVSLVLMFGPSYPSEQCLVIEIIDDSLAEELEQFYVVLSSSSEAINITDREFNITIEPNNFESGACTEGSVTMVSDADNSSHLQLVEMCSSEGVWSPVCDTSWTTQDATVVCREVGRLTSEDSVIGGVVPEPSSGTIFPECLGNEMRLVACSTSSPTDDTLTCNPVLVNCDHETDGDGGTDRVNMWMVVSSIVVAVIVVLVLVIAIGLMAIVYSRWRTPGKQPKMDADNYTDNNIYTVPKSHSPVSDVDVLSDSLSYNLENPLYMDANSSQPSSDAPEHTPANTLHTDDPPPPHTPVTEPNSVLERAGDGSVTEPHYDTPHSANTDVGTDSSDRHTCKHHQYEYIH